MGCSDPRSISKFYNLFIILLYIETISSVLAHGLSENTELSFIKGQGSRRSTNAERVGEVINKRYLRIQKAA